MAIYLGYYHPAPEFARAQQARARAGDLTPDAAFTRRVLALPEQLPPGCTLRGAYVPVGWLGTDPSDLGFPAVMVVETANPADLSFISQYYLGYLMFRWTPATAAGTTRQERAVALEAAAVNAAMLMETLGVEAGA